MNPLWRRSGRSMLAPTSLLILKLYVLVGVSKNLGVAVQYIAPRGKVFAGGSWFVIYAIQNVK